MNFYIQAGTPAITYAYNPEDCTISDAIETVFPMCTENAILYWDHIPISLSYKYDLSYMISDVLDLIDAISTTSIGKMQIQWLPDSFRCDWTIEWEDNNIEIVANWENIAGDVQKILSEHNQIKIPVKVFICEWKKVFKNIIYNLISCGYLQSEIKDFERLVKAVDCIQGQGILYNCGQKDNPKIMIT